MAVKRKFEAELDGASDYSVCPYVNLVHAVMFIPNRGPPHRRRSK